MYDFRERDFEKELDVNGVLVKKLFIFKFQLMAFFFD